MTRSASTRSTSYLLSSLCLLVLALFGSGCDSMGSEEATRPTLSGVWTGPITHANPNLDGTLTLTLTQAGDALTGTAQWRFSGQSISGTVLGTVHEDGTVTYTLDFGRNGLYFHDGALQRHVLTGTWVSARSAGISGTVTLELEITAES
ncbi:MAG: hypothetical protein AAGI71_07570 [Bacteroidota bacterium]